MAIILVAIGGYYINGYWWIFCQWILVAINGYCINGYCTIVLILLMAIVLILLMAIGGYSINGYWWLLY